MLIKKVLVEKRQLLNDKVLPVSRLEADVRSVHESVSKAQP